MDVDSVECVGAIAVEISQFLEWVVGGAGVLGGDELYKKDETKSKNGELFIRRIFSNFDKIALLSSPLFSAVVVFVSPLSSSLGVFLDERKKISRSESFMLLFAMI